MRVFMLLKIFFLSRLFIICESFLFNRRSKTVCRSRHNVEWCFSNEEPFTSLSFPRQAEEIGTKFLLYSRSNRNNFQELFYHEPQTITDSVFDIAKKTKIIIHGFREKAQNNWIQELKDAILDRDDVNVIIVDYGNGTGRWPLLYSQWVGDARLVGFEAAHFISVLRDQTGIELGDIHIIAYSLGCPIAGWVGEQFGGELGRITGLDATRMGFPSNDPKLVLERGDAQFVDAIHTNCRSLLAFGTPDPYGHIDFYPNGGDNNPGCSGLMDITCNHFRARYLMIDSLVNDDKPMMGFPCNDVTDFEDGKCNECGEEGCAKMGYYATKPKSKFYTSITYYIKTGEEPPYSVFH